MQLYRKTLSRDPLDFYHGLLGLAVFLLLGAAAFAQDASLTVDIRPTTAEIGDRVVATLTLTQTAEAVGPPVFPDWEDSWGEAELMATGPVEELGGSRFRQEVTLTVFRTGEVTLPPVTVEVPLPEQVLAVTSEPRVLEIRSVLPQDVEDPEARPPAPPRALPIGETFWRSVVGLALACLAAAFFLARRRATDVGDESRAIPPLEALAKDLEGLRSSKDPVAFHTGLSLCVRRFLGRCFAFPALESTTTEVRRRLLGAEVPTATVSRVERLLRRSDLVKFAHEFAPAGRVRQEPDAGLEEALALGGEIDRYLRPPDPEITDRETERAA